MSNQHIIEKLWYSRSRLGWFFWPFHLFFRMIVVFKRYLYSLNIFSKNKFSKPVLVVGNITIGGTGKTPFINQFIKLLNKHDIRVGLVSRGYGADLKDFPHAITSTDSARRVGDEAYMQFQDLNVCSNLNIPIVISPNRSEAVDYITNNSKVDLIISDDGLQHYKMSRDYEILLFDGSRLFGNQLVLPFGPLREPMSRLKSIGLLIQNGGTKTTFSDNVVTLNSNCFVNLKTKEEFSLESFSTKSVHAVAGIGNPQRFYDSLSTICKIKTQKSFADHYQFKKCDFSEYGDDTVIMTEKDATKCYSFAEDNWYYLKVEMDFGEKLSEILVRTTRKII